MEFPYESALFGLVIYNFPSKSKFMFQPLISGAHVSFREGATSVEVPEKDDI